MKNEGSNSLFWIVLRTARKLEQQNPLGPAKRREGLNGYNGDSADNCRSVRAVVRLRAPGAQLVGGSARYAPRHGFSERQSHTCRLVGNGTVLARGMIGRY